MKNCLIQSLYKRLLKYKRLILSYVVILLLSTGLSFLFVLDAVKPSQTFKDFISFTVGISGTLASLYSIFVSAKSDIQLNEEKQAREDFYNKLDLKLGYISDNTDSLKKSVDLVLQAESHKDIAVCYSTPTPTGPTHSDDNQNTDEETDISSATSWNSKEKSNEHKVN